MSDRRPTLARLIPPPNRLVVVALLMDLSAGCMMLAQQFRGIELKAQPLMLGMLGTGIFAVYIPVAIISGPLSNRLGRRAVAVLATSLFTLANLSMGFVGSIWSLVALAGLAGAGLALLWPPVEAWLADLSDGSPRLLARHLTTFNLAWTVGLMFGPLISGTVWEVWGRQTFIVAGAAAAACLLLVLLTPKAPPGHEAPPPVHAAVSPQTIWLYLLISWFATFAAACARMVINVGFPKLGESLGYTPTFVGFAVFALAFGQFIGFLVMRSTTRWHYRLMPLLGAMLGDLILLVVCGLTRSAPVFVASFVLIGTTLGITYMASITYALQAEAETRGKQAGIHEGVMGLGLFSGPLLAGLSAQYVSLQAPFFAGAALCGLALVGQMALWLTRRRRLAKA